jgi:hypothetical protein
MKKIVLFSLIAIAAITANATDMTKEQFVARQKATAEKAGKEFNEKASAAFFAIKDLNKDGVLSGDEQKPVKPATPNATK